MAGDPLPFGTQQEPGGLTCFPQEEPRTGGGRGAPSAAAGLRGPGRPALLGTLSVWVVGPQRKLCRHYDELSSLVFLSHVQAFLPLKAAMSSLFIQGIFTWESLG